MRSKGAVVLAVVLAVLAVLLVSFYLKQKEDELIPQAQLRPVLIATTDILQNTVIEEGMVQQIQVPTRYFQPMAESDRRQVVGRLAAVPIPKGAQIQGTYIMDGNRTALAYEVPRGKRAVTIAINDISGVGGMIRPGNFVDILGTFEYGRPVQGRAGLEFTDEKTEVRLFMQNIQVVAVDKEHRREPPPTKGQVGDQPPQQPVEKGYGNVTVLATPDEAQRLVLAQQVGALTLVLRSNLDAGQIENLPHLDPMGLLGVPIPLKPKARPVWREYRGGGQF
jgi:pilus assembly protein CpaB